MACGFTFISYSARRSRIPARREQVYVINLVKRWIRSVLGFYKIPRRRDEDPTSPNALEENAPREKAMSDRQRSLPDAGLAALPERRTERLVRVVRVIALVLGVKIPG